MCLQIPGRHRGHAGLASQRRLQVPVEVHLLAGHAGAAAGHHHPHVHQEAHVHGLEPREGTRAR